MKILQLVTKRQYRGAEVFAAGLSEMLALNGHEVIFAGLYPVSENILTAKKAINFDLGGRKTAFNISLLASLIKLIRKEKPDIIQANGSDTLKYAVFAKLFLPGLHIVYRNISMVSAWAKQDSMKRKFNRFLFRQVDRVTSVGQQSLEDLVKTYAYPLSKTKLIRRGIPEFIYDPDSSRKKICHEFGFLKTDRILVHIGQFSTEKNHVFLIECFEKIKAGDPAVKLLFIGEGINLAAIKEFVSQKGLCDYIFFAGHRENVQEILAGCDLFILGSTIEGVPGVILEAAMQSVPAVAVNTGGVGEVVINEKTGILISDHDTSVFSHAVISLLKDERYKNTLGKNAKAFVMEHYSLQLCLKQFEALYDEILRSDKEIKPV